MARATIDLWPAAAAMIDRAGSLDALRAHRLQLLAASLWASDGRMVPENLMADRRRAVSMALAAPSMLARVRDSYDGRLLLFKGPEVAACYPDRGARYFHDLDLIADDAPAAQRALVAAGFVEQEFPGGWPDIHHLRPLNWPGLPLDIEVHSRPKLPDWLPAPRAEELMERAVPSATGIDGVLSPDPVAHALLLAAHGWGHRPLGRLGDHVDIAAVLPFARWPEAAALARSWGWGELWDLTAATGAAVLRGERAPTLVRTLGRHLLEVRDLTVSEFHALRILGPALAVPRRRAAGVLRDRVLDLCRPDAGQTRREQLTRAAGALRHARATKASRDVLNNTNPWSR